MAVCYATVVNVLRRTLHTLPLQRCVMLKPPKRVEPYDWGHEHYIRVRFICGCGRVQEYLLDRGEDLSDLACRRCWRRERNRLAMRQRRGSALVLQDRPCLQCGSIFTPERSTARYCSTRCRVAAHRAKPS